MLYPDVTNLVAESEGFPSNSIFEELADWEDQLRAIEQDRETENHAPTSEIEKPDLQGGPV